MDDPSHGVETTIIDLGLARMDGGGGVHWTPFDDEIFEGEGDYQFDIYRMMKGSVGEEYRPITNVMVSDFAFYLLVFRCVDCINCSVGGVVVALFGV